MQTITPTLLNDIFTGFTAKFNDVYTSTPDNIDKVAMSIPSNGKSSKYGWLKEIPGMREWTGSRNANALESNGYEITNVHYEDSIIVNRDDIEDDQIGMYSGYVPMLAANAKADPEYKAVNLLIDGFVDTCYDGKAFFADDHSWKGNTIDNKGALSLSDTNFATAKAALWKMVGGRGKNGEAPLISNPQFRLIVGPALEATARAIVTAQFASSGASNVNYNAADLFVSPLITANAGKNNNVAATNYWFLIVTNAAGSIMPLVHQMRQAPRTTSLISDTDYSVYDKNAYQWGVDMRYGVGYGLYQLAWGSAV